MNKKTLALISDWKYEYYNRNCNDNNTWKDYQEFIDRISEYYFIKIINMPGFGGVNEPINKEYSIEDFAEYLDKYLINNTISPDYILGVGFGANVLIKWKSKYKRKSKIILIDSIPLTNNELIKKYSNNTITISGMTGILKQLFEGKDNTDRIIKDASSFLKKSLVRYVNTNLYNELIDINYNEVLLIFNQNNTITNYLQLFNMLPLNHKGRVALINNTSDALKTNCLQVIEIIKKIY